MKNLERLYNNPKTASQFQGINVALKISQSTLEKPYLVKTYGSKGDIFYPLKERYVFLFFFLTMSFILS